VAIRHELAFALDGCGIVVVVVVDRVRRGVDASGIGSAANRSAADASRSAYAC